MTTAATGGPPKLTNLYHLRTVGTPKSCSICSKETTLCLANADVTDFLYTCQSHLLDPGFARAASSSTTDSPASSAPPSPSAVPQSEIDKVKAEYEEKAKRKKEASEQKDASKDSSSSSGWIAGSLKTGFSAVSSLATTSASTLFPPPPPQTPSASELARAAAKDAKVFTLNRDIFRMRQDAARKRWQAKEAKERVKGLSLPSAPRGSPGAAVKPPGGL